MVGSKLRFLDEPKDSPAWTAAQGVAVLVNLGRLNPSVRLTLRNGRLQPIVMKMSVKEYVKNAGVFRRAGDMFRFIGAGFTDVGHDTQREIGKMILKKAQELVPVQTGALKASVDLILSAMELEFDLVILEFSMRRLLSLADSHLHHLHRGRTLDQRLLMLGLRKESVTYR